jgi:eukaryotic-like serine/threonine-protein kinase
MGLVHRDVSPQNLLISFSGTAKLVDFGIAKVTARSSGLTEAGEVKGKFAFMAPEQVRGQAVDCRTDLFALGILLYAITTNKHPFRGAHPGETLQNICSDRAPTPPSAFLSDYPAALEQVVMKALSKAPDQRFSTANEMLEALERAMPEALEQSFEVEVASYLRGLYGAQAAARRAAIREAQEHADRMRADSSASSVGTLRAISIDSPENGSFSVQPTPSRSSRPSSSVSQITPPSPWPRRLAAAGALAGLLIAGLALRSSGVATTAASAAGASPVVLETLPATSATAPRPSVEAPPVAPVPAPSLDAKPEASTHEKSDKKPGRSRVVVVAPRAAAAAVPSELAREPAPVLTSAPAPASPAPTPANAWDRGAFGGRH